MSEPKRPLQLSLFEVQGNPPEHLIQVPRDIEAAEAAADRQDQHEDGSNALSQAQAALDLIRSEDLSHPRALDMLLDGLATALLEVPAIKAKLEPVGEAPLRSVLMELVGQKNLHRRALKSLDKIESILGDLGCHAAGPDSENWSGDPSAHELGAAVGDLCDEVGSLLDAMGEGETGGGG
jgi:hypothetical protein